MPKEARNRQTILSNDGRYVTLDLPYICLLVHMYYTGADVSLDRDQYNYWCQTLEIALDNWKEEREENKLFDDAVKNLVRATLLESQRTNKFYEDEHQQEKD